MGDGWHNPIEHRDRLHKEWSTVQPIEKDKHGKEETYSERSKELISKPLLFAAMFFYVKKFLNLFSSRKKMLAIDLQQLSSDLLAFRDLILTLQSEDKSYDLDFAQNLSQLWHNMTDDCNHLAATELSPSETVRQLTSLVEEMSHFPKNEEHSFGFYLTESVGRQWLPFPFLDILRQLYNEHQAQPEESTLARWSSQLANIAEMLKLHKS